MSWIKFEVTTPDKPEVFAIADTLGIDPDAVVGKLLRFWCWADAQTTNGNANTNGPSVSKSLVDRLASHPGFADAMIGVGWLVVTDTSLTIPSFDTHNGQTAKTRALTAKRVAKHAHVTNGPSVSQALPREEKEKNNTNTPVVDEKRKSKARSKHSYSEPFERFWSIFPPQRKDDKLAASKAFDRAVDGIGTPNAAEFLIRQATVYAQSPKGLGKYCKSPESWLSKGSYDASPEAWEVATSTHESSPPTSAATSNREPAHVKAKRELEARRAAEAAGATS
ncbi:MAG: hypothetical protein NTW52_08170 [Planctomycetota bacterium]|nr:hypothetical protein [Planctomycetota bacterium]